MINERRQSEECEAIVKKIIFWNMALLVFGSVNGVMSIAEIPSILKPEIKVDMSNPSLVNVTDPVIIKTVEKSMTMLANPFISWI